MASASAMHRNAGACGCARNLSCSKLGGGVPSAASLNAQLMCAFPSRSHAVQHFSFRGIGGCETPFLTGSRGAPLRFALSAIWGTAAAAKNSAEQLTQRRAQAVAKGASEVPDAEPAGITGNTLETQGKRCPDCRHSKPLVDFEKTVTSMDGRTDVCRACLAVLRAKSTQKELHHLGMSVTEAWERAKACWKCGLRKELRDFGRDSKRKDQTRCYCRACQSVLDAGRPRSAPTDQPLRCNRCEEVKAANQFDLKPTGSSTGRQGTCKSCQCESVSFIRQKRRNTRIYLPRVTKKCTACGKQKRACEFYLDSGAVDGLFNQCRSCVQVAEKKRKQRGVQKRRLQQSDGV